MATAPTIDKTRWAEVQKRGLKSGAHRAPSAGMCAMEAVAYIRRQPHSDHPPCVSPVIGAFMRSWNDGLSNDERGILIPLLPKLIDTVNPELEERRSLMAADWLVRVHTPAWLRLAGLNDSADALANLPEITAMAQVPSIRGPIEAARKDATAAWDAARAAARAAAGAAAGDAARAAARAAAGDAAGAAAWDAARAAARDAAGDAAGAAAWDAAWDAAGAAAWDAAGAAAWDAARAAARAAAWAAAGDAAGDAARAAAGDAAGDAAKKKLEPTRLELQQSAVKLVERMCELSAEQVSA